jgi:GT2 family glycosyltransferase
LVPDDDVLLLNPDVVAPPGSIELLESYARNHVHVGIVVPRLVYEDGSTQESVRQFPNPLALLARRSSWFRGTGLGHRVISSFLLEGEAASEPRPVQWAIGAVQFVRRSAIRDVGGMQEWIFLYGEDMDWCYRMWQRGWQVHLVPQAIMQHRYQRLSRSTLDVRSAATRHHWASLLKLFILHPSLLVGRGPRAAHEATRRFATTRAQ